MLKPDLLAARWANSSRLSTKRSPLQAFRRSSFSRWERSSIRALFVVILSCASLSASALALSAEDMARSASSSANFRRRSNSLASYGKVRPFFVLNMARMELGLRSTAEYCGDDQSPTDDMSSPLRCAGNRPLVCCKYIEVFCGEVASVGSDLREVNVLGEGRRSRPTSVRCSCISLRATPAGIPERSSSSL
jgi:hypothetical protein